MNSQNDFVGGVDRDTAPDLIERTRLRDLRNFRLATVDGQGLILTSVAGNDEQFGLSSGFVPLGHAVFQGIAFIFSVNPVTGEGEIGCFPSPIDTFTGGFQRVYQPLQNFTGTTDPRGVSSPVRENFRSECLGFDCEHQMEVEARISYDNSVELFFTDFNNQLRHVNAGFDIDTGISNRRFYWHGNDGTPHPLGPNPECSVLQNALNVFFETCGYPVKNNVTVEGGGSLEAGNWFLHFRYLTSDLTPTSFLSQVGPIQVTTDGTPQGARLDGDAENVNTGKKIVITLDNIDSNYPYIEVGYSYHHGDTYDTGLFDRQFVIPAGSGQITLDITGNDARVDLTLAELVKPKSIEDTPRTICQSENRLWGFNWKQRDVDVELMREVALDVTADAPLDSELYLAQDWRAGQSSTVFQYKDLQDTLDRVGYFRGEAYAFAVVFVFNDGKESIPFPVTGQDLYPGGLGGTNEQGVLRFPLPNTLELYDGTNAKVMGVKFDTSGSVLGDLEDDICGFYFVRAERNPQLVYQGLAVHNWTYDNAPGTAGPVISPTFVDHSTNKIPEFIGLANGNLDMDVPWRTAGLNGIETAAGNVIRDADTMAILSADHFFNKTFANSGYVLVEVGRIGMAVSSQDANTIPAYLYDQISFLGIAGTPVVDVDCFNVAGRTPVSTGPGFVSFFYEGNGDNVGSPYVWFYGNGLNGEVGNREVVQRTYIGCSKNALATTLAQPDLNTVRLVNIYRSDPTLTDVSTLYFPGTTLYYRISEFYDVSQWGGTFIEYNGDCFLGRNYFKSTHSGGFHDASEFNGSIRYEWGNLYGAITENAVNVAMRRQDEDNSAITYYPEYNISTPISFMAFVNDNEESDLVNNGYSRTLNLRGVLGDDEFVPIRGNWYPTRGRYSNRYVNDSAINDGYLNWDIDAFEDFDHSPGEIMKAIAFRGQVYTVHRHAIRRHYIAERFLNQTASEGELVLGEGDTLSDRSEVISGELGTQHQWSIIRTDRAFYGYDQKMRSVWRVGYDGMREIAHQKMFANDVYTISEPLDDFSDAVNNTQDNPICVAGVVGFYDRKHLEVGWSFLWLLQQNPGDENDIRYNETIVYNEKLDVYMGKRDHHSPYYITLHEDMYSMDPGTAPWDADSSGATFWLHDKLSDHAVFYGQQFAKKISAIVNPMSGSPKLFSHCALAGSDVALQKVDFFTEFQSSSIDPFVSNPSFWLEPRYKENSWHFTVPKTTTILPNAGNVDYGISSPIRGKWMQVDMYWNDTEPVRARSLVTSLRLSLQ